MAKEKNYENLSTEKLKKRLLFSNIIAIILGIAAITATVFYFLDRENNSDLLIVGAGVGVGLSSFLAITANQIKKEIKRRVNK